MLSKRQPTQLDCVPVTRAVLSFMSRHKDIKNAKFYAEFNGYVGSFWNRLHGIAIPTILFFYIQ